MTEHAKLSASGSQRWINCAGSVKAEEGLPNVTSSYAEEGKKMHAYAAESLYHLLKEKHTSDIKLDDEQTKSVNQYINYVFNLFKDIEGRNGLNAFIGIEQLIPYDQITPEGFGTVDAILYDQDAKTLHIIDLKCGKGIKEFAKDNTQLLLYLFGIINLIRSQLKRKWDDDITNDIKKFVLHIVQPRLNHFDQWVIEDNQELNKWAQFLKEKAIAALDPDAKRTPHEKACRWCKAKPTCPALYNLTEQLFFGAVKNDIDEGLGLEKKFINENERQFILDNSKLIKDFIVSVEADAYSDLTIGKEVKGYKLTKGRFTLKYFDDALDIVQNHYNDQKELLTETKMIGITKLREVSKSNKVNFLEHLTYQQESNPVMVKKLDEEEELIIDIKFEDEFESLD